VVGRLVVDSSALIDYLLGGSPRSPFASVFRDGDLHVPEVCDVEIVSALRRPVLAGALSAHSMQLLLLDYAELPLRRHRHMRLVGRAFELRDNFSAADAMYVALAERLDASLATADRGLARATRFHTSLEVIPLSSSSRPSG